MSKKLKRTPEIFCSCRKPQDGDMICCDECDEWYHYKCAGITAAEVPGTTWFCFICTRVIRSLQKWDSIKARQSSALVSSKDVEADTQQNDSELQREFKKTEVELEKVREENSRLESMLEDVNNNDKQLKKTLQDYETAIKELERVKEENENLKHVTEQGNKVFTQLQKLQHENEALSFELRAAKMKIASCQSCIDDNAKRVQNKRKLSLGHMSQQ